MKIIILYFHLLIFLLFSINGLGLKVSGNKSKASIFDFNRNDLFADKKFDLHNFFQHRETKPKNTLQNIDNFKFKAKQDYNENCPGGDCDAIHQGWLKLLEINEETSDVPNTFSKNKMYFLQMSENTGMSTIAKDNIGYINIPNEDYFFVQLTQSHINVYTARNNPYKKLEKKVALKDLGPEISMNPCKGGVEDIGNFAEGYCFMIKYINYSRHFIWEFCTDNIYEKDKWMNTIIKATMKINAVQPGHAAFTQVRTTIHTPGIIGYGVGVGAPLIPHGPSLFDSHATIVTPGVNGMVTNVAPPMGIPVGPAFPMPLASVPFRHTQTIMTTPAGTFVEPGPTAANIIQTVPGAMIAGFRPMGIWAPCSKPCGHGYQTRPIECMNLNICKGKQFEERMCNIQACKDDVEQHLEKLKKVSEGQWEYLGTWSDCTRPCGGGIQTIHRKCIAGSCMGETTLTQDCNTFLCSEMHGQDPKKMPISAVEPFDINKYDECKLLAGKLMLVINNQRVLSHVEVNLQTIQIYSQNNPRVPIIMPLNSLSEVRPSVSAPTCFKVCDKLGKMVYLCPQDPQMNICNQWVKRINDFRHNCSNKVLNNFQNEITASIKMSSDPHSSELKIAQIQKKVIEDEKMQSSVRERMLEKQFEEFKKQTRDLLEKEDIYETKLEQQEKERLDWEEKKMRENVLKEQMNAQKLLQDMQTIAISENTYTMKERAIKKEMKNLMSEVQTKISSKREKLINKLQRMKTIHEIGEKKAAKELIEVKKDLSKKLSNLSKKGNPNQCFANNNNPINIETYCTQSYQKDYDIQIECKKPSQFCYMCCDNEIGPLNKENLDCCYNHCDDIANSTCMTFNETFHVNQSQVAFLN